MNALDVVDAIILSHLESLAELRGMSVYGGLYAKFKGHEEVLR